jgi:hypothetical protein
MGINLCDINNWSTSNGPAKYLPNNYSTDLDFTRYSFIRITRPVMLQAEECFNKKLLDNDLLGVTSITANDLSIAGGINVSCINCSNLSVMGVITAQGFSSPNITINITSKSGNISMSNGSISPFINSKVTGVGSVNVPSNSYISKSKQCILKYFLEDSNQQRRCIDLISPIEDGGNMVLSNNSSIGSNVVVNAGYTFLNTNSSNFGIINSFCRLDRSINHGKISDICILDDAQSYGEISGPLALFYNGAINGGTLSAGKSVFKGGTNEGTGVGTLYFLTGGANNNVCLGSCFLLGGSNEGRIAGNVMISGGGTNNGTISGSVTIYDGGSTSTDGAIFGSVNASFGTIEGYIEGSLSAKDCTGGELSLIGQSTFIRCSITSISSIKGSISANASYLNTVYFSGSSIVCDQYSEILDGLLTVDSASFRTSSNGADIAAGNAVFQSGSVNNGRLLGGTNGIFTFATNNGSIESGTAVFNNSFNFGSVFGESINFTKSTNDGSIDCLSSVSFSSSINNGNVTVSETNVVNFSDKSENYATIFGNASFSNKSFNYGTIDGDATFDSTSFNYGAVLGECVGPGC